VPDGYVTLSCEKCGAPLRVYDDAERLACAHCGTSMVALRRGGTVSLRRVEQRLEDVAASTDRMADELALARYKSELEELQTQRIDGDPRVARLGWAALVALILFVAGVILLIPDESRPLSIPIFALAIALFAYCVTLARRVRDPLEARRTELHTRIATLRARLDEAHAG
jgi:ribosomal protein S27E